MGAFGSSQTSCYHTMINRTALCAFQLHYYSKANRWDIHKYLYRYWRFFSNMTSTHLGVVRVLQSSLLCSIRSLLDHLQVDHSANRSTFPTPWSFICISFWFSLSLRICLSMHRLYVQLTFFMQPHFSSTNCANIDVSGVHLAISFLCIEIWN